MNKFLISFILIFAFFTGPAFADSGIKITAPADGTTVSPGQQITVTAEAVGGFTLTGGWVGIHGSPEQKLTALPQSAVLTVPQDAIGAIVVRAATTGTPDKLVSDKITLNIQQTAALQSIMVEPEDYYFETDWNGSPDAQEHIYLKVKGVYSDGITRDISSQGTSYISSDPGIASVDNNGKVRPLAEGMSTITVSNSGINAAVPISITRPQGISRSETASPISQINIEPSPNAAGWNNSDVTATINAADNPGGSGVDEIIYQLYSQGPEEQFVKGGEVVIAFSQEIRDTLNYMAVDNERNQEVAHSVNINIDKTQPLIDLQVPVDSRGYNLGEDVPASWSVSDQLSGIASGQGTVANGAAIDTATLGTKTFSVVAADNAGNQSTKIVTYTVSRITYYPSGRIESKTLADNSYFHYIDEPESRVDREIASGTDHDGAIAYIYKYFDLVTEERVVTTSQTWPEGVYAFKTLTIQPGVVLTFSGPERTVLYVKDGIYLNGAIYVEDTLELCGMVMTVCGMNIGGTPPAVFADRMIYVGGTLALGSGLDMGGQTIKALYRKECYGDSGFRHLVATYTYDTTGRFVSKDIPPRSAQVAVSKKNAPGNLRPIAFISGIKRFLPIGRIYLFKGSGRDVDGKVTACEWRSGINGFLGNKFVFIKRLSKGRHTVTFRVKDKAGLWSNPVSKTIYVK